MGDINSAVSEWKEENQKLSKIKKGKVDLSEFVTSLDGIKKAFGKMNETLHSFTSAFVNSTSRAVAASVARSEGNAEVIEESVKIEEELQSVLRSFGGVILE